MRNNDHAALLAVTETLENLAFMEAFPVQEDVSSAHMEMTAALLIHEPQQGEIRIALPVALLEGIAQNVFGMPAEGMALPDTRDLLAELLNTIAGRYLIELLPPDQPFRIGLPELDQPPAFGEDLCTMWHFRVDEHLLTLSVSHHSDNYSS